MTAAVSHAQLFEAFDALCDLPTDEQRLRLLQIAREDPPLARELAALLTVDRGPLSALGAQDTLAAVIGRVTEGLNPTHPLVAQLETATPEVPVPVGPYLVTGRLGAGGQGAVFAARDSRVEREVALKVLRHTTPAALERFKAEFRAVAKWSHPHLVTLYELAATEDDVWYLTMARVEDGRDLVSAVLDGASFDAAAQGRLRRLLPQVVEGLSALHRRGMLHLDVKPANVLVDRRGHVRLLDFGLARSREDGSPSGEVTSGTPGYMAPEQVEGGALGPAADFYALGVMLFRVFTGRLPFEGGVALHLKTEQDAPRVRHTTRTELPSDLAELTDRLLARSPSARPSEADIRRVVGLEVDGQGARSSLFFGRSKELEALSSALGDGGPDEATVMVVEGRSGIGKTALLDRFAAEAEAAGARVVRWRCHPGEHLPFAALDGLVRDLAEGHPALSECVHLGAMFPALGVAGRPVDISAPVALRNAADELRRLMWEHPRADAPLLLILDDTHWGDADSARLLLRVLSRPSPPLTLVMANRGSTNSRGAFHTALDRQDLDAICRFRRMALGPLDPSQVVEWVRAVAPHADADAISTRAAGVPVFVDALTRSTSQEAPHATLEEVISSQLDGLGSEARRLVQVLSQARGPLEHRLLIDASNRLGEPIVDPIGTLRLLATQRLTMGEAVAQDAPVELFHDKLRLVVDALIEREGGGTRARVHGALAATLEEAGSPAVLVAEHHWLSGNRAAAGRLAWQAGDEARAAMAFRSAASHYQQALDWTPTLRREDEALLRRALADALAAANAGPAAADEFLRLRDRFEAPQERREAGLLAAQQLFYSGQFARAQEAAADLLTSFELKWPQSERQALLETAWNVLLLKFRRERFKSTPASACAPRDLERLDTLLALGRGAALAENSAAAALLTRYIRHSLASGEPHRVAKGLGHYIFARSFNGNIDAARQTHSRARALAIDVGDPQTIQFVDMCLGLAETYNGDMARAEALQEHVLASLDQAGLAAPYERGIAGISLMTSRFALGHYSTLHRECLTGLSTRLEANDPWGEALYRVGLLACAIPLGRPIAVLEREAVRACDALEVPGWGVLHSMLTHGRVLMLCAASRVEEAMDLLEANRVAAERSGAFLMRFGKTVFYGLLARLCAVAGSLNPDRPRALKSARRWRKKLLGDRTGFGRASVALVDATMAHAAGDNDAAIAAFKRAAPLLHDTGFQAHHVAVQMHLARLTGLGTEGLEQTRRTANNLGIADPERFAQTLIPLAWRKALTHT